MTEFQIIRGLMETMVRIINSIEQLNYFPVFVRHGSGLPPRGRSIISALDHMRDTIHSYSGPVGLGQTCSEVLLRDASTIYFPQTYAICDYQPRNGKVALGFAVGRLVSFSCLLFSTENAAYYHMPCGENLQPILPVVF